jgi:hypothetical protein
MEKSGRQRRSESAWRELVDRQAPAATSNSSTRGRVKLLHWTAAGGGMITRRERAWQVVRRLP